MVDPCVCRTVADLIVSAVAFPVGAVIGFIYGVFHQKRRHA